jgi:hypothetical protein
MVSRDKQPSPRNRIHRQYHRTKPLYLKENNGHDLLYVDDILILANAVQLSSIKSLLKSKYRMTDLRRACQYLGIRIQQKSTDTTLDQTWFIKQVLKKLGLSECNGHFTPLDPGSRKTMDIIEPALPLEKELY